MALIFMAWFIELLISIEQMGHNYEKLFFKHDYWT